MSAGWPRVLLRPSTDGGDLLLLHAIGIHGLVLLAVPAVLLARTATTAVRQLQVTALAVASVAVGMTVLLVQAFRQLSLDQLDTMALATLASCAAALLAMYVIVAAALLKRSPNPAGSGG